MKILFYGRLADSIGPELELEAPAGSSVAQLRQRLVSDYPEVSTILGHKRSRACVGNSVVGEDYKPGAGEALEFLPPVSGG